MKYWILFCFFIFNIVEAYDHPLVVAAIFQDEAPYLKEWIEYHKMIGVTYFRLYNNESTDDWEPILSPYINAGEVEVIDWPTCGSHWCIETQWPQIQDAIRFFVNKSQWLAIIDIDEYLVPLEDPDMLTFLEKYEDHPGVVLNWQCFGTSFISEIPQNRLMIEVLTLKAEPFSIRNFPVKSIVRPEMVDLSSKNWPPHTFYYYHHLLPVWPDKVVFKGGFPNHSNLREIQSRIHPSKAVINHYVHRSESYFWGQKLLKKENMEQGIVTKRYATSWHEDCNQEKDIQIHRFIPELQKRMGLEK